MTNKEFYKKFNGVASPAYRGRAKGGVRPERDQRS